MMKKLNFKESKHLVERSGIGAELKRIHHFMGKPLDAAIDEILSATTKSKITPPVLLHPYKYRQAKKAFRKSGNSNKAGELTQDERDRLINWGLHNLIDSDNPLQQRMVWFWHNHFTSSVRKVRSAHMMLDQDLLIRKKALGSFADLLKGISFEPAMLIYLDGKTNIKGQPNENFSRELLEIFTLGEGHYSEKDIKEAARAFSGWGIHHKKANTIFRKQRHDDGVKTFMGKTGKLKADDILSIILSTPRTAEFICEKIWREFISIDKPDPLTIKSWATVLRSSNYNMSALLKTVFSSKQFWADDNYGALIKSPIDIIIGSLRTLEISYAEIPPPLLRRQFKWMGQSLYHPPNVKGWQGGKAWVDDISLPMRQQFLQRLTRGISVSAKKTSKPKQTSNTMKGKMMDSTMQTSMSMKVTPQELPTPRLPHLDEKQWAKWLLPVPPINNIQNKPSQKKIIAIFLDPAYQIK